MSHGTTTGQALARHAHRRFWQGIAETEGDDHAAAHGSVAPPLVDRRAFMKIMAASLALAGVPGCSRSPLESIVPYHDGPPQQTYGKPVFYASVLPRDGYGLGVLVETNMGRPTKIEGNPSHPASGGATDVFRQAAVLDLWDPDRSQSVLQRGNPTSWSAFTGALEARLRALPARDGAGLRVLTGMVASASLHHAIQGVLARFPQARWHQWQPVNRDRVHAGMAAATGVRGDVLLHLDRARVVLAIDGDVLDEHPAFVQNAIAFATTREAHATLSMRSRMYALECTPTLTGANADHRLPLRASDMHLALREIAHAVGALADNPGTRVVPPEWLQSIAADLHQHRGACIVTVGYRQPAATHALAYAINAHLGNIGRTMEVIAPAAVAPVDHTASLQELVAAMASGSVDVLVATGVNPVYDAPADLDFAAALAKVSLKVHHGLYVDETAKACDWHVPAAHPLECWGDLASFDGTVALQQPCIEPIYAGRSAHEMLAALGGDSASAPREMVRAHWSRTLATDAEVNEALRTGVMTRAAASGMRPPIEPGAGSARPSLPAAPAHAVDADDIELVFAPDPRAGDGSHANNAWLQELPKPLSLLTWDNAAMVAPALATRLGLTNADVVELRLFGRSVPAPVWIMPGMPDRSVTLTLGYGRTDAGVVGNGRGTNAYAVRTTGAPWVANGLSIVKTGRRQPLACTQVHHSMAGRDIVRAYTVREAQACTPQACGTPGLPARATLYASPPAGPYAWAMSVDLSACIGCGACTIACQAENNIPVVGHEEVMNGREMHWIRVDRYYDGPVGNPATLFQPVPCMHCEHAPCEPVCPVAASVHDAQGLNVQVYNRCVGTRFCSNNCPYKVRRFNFLQYARDTPSLNAQRNPEVTVRMRGVMEKCNYCLQRITTAKVGADAEGRQLRDGEVVTACQAVCPTRAIVFGDLNQPDSAVNARKRSPLDYALLAELNTRPRTTYLPRITNPGTPGRS